jgi:hypothetical protein
MTELELQREARAVEERALQIVELDRLNAELRLKQRIEARKAEIDTARAALVELERRNAEEDIADKRDSAATETATAGKAKAAKADAAAALIAPRRPLP